MYHLLYADDTVLVEVPFIDNLLTIKVTLKSFQLGVGLKVNISKNNQFGVKLGMPFRDLAEGFFIVRLVLFLLRIWGSWWVRIQRKY